MAFSLTEEEIAQLIAERKELPAEFQQKLHPKPKIGHVEAELSLVGENGSEFVIIFRQAQIEPLDFSVILSYKVPNSDKHFRLRRYNGKSHEHSNPLESKVRFFDFHIHMATERYQEAGGYEEDMFAEPSDRYSDMNDAFSCMIADCGFIFPPNYQLGMFPGKLL